MNKIIKYLMDNEFIIDESNIQIINKLDLWDIIKDNKKCDLFKLLNKNKNCEIIVDIKYKPTLLISNKIYELPLKVVFFYNDVEYNIYNLKNVIEK